VISETGRFNWSIIRAYTRVLLSYALVRAIVKLILGILDKIEEGIVLKVIIGLKRGL
jgi:hypothetical protein